MNKSIVYVALFCTLAVTNSFAVDAIPKAERDQAAAALSKVSGVKVSPDAIITTSLPGVYEARLPSGPVYVAKDASWVLRGDIVNVAKNENLNQKAVTEMQKVTFSAIPLSNSLKIVIGNGSRKLITFEDPNCGYCKKFAEEMQKLTNVTIYVQPVAMIAPTSAEKVTNILCAEKPSIAWQDAMLRNKDAAPCKDGAKKEMAEKKMQANQAVAQKYFISGTPTLVFEDNTRANGGMSVSDLEARLTQASKTVAVAKK